MCVALPAVMMIASTAITAAGAAASVMGQKDSAAQQRAYQNALAVQRNQQIEENRKLAVNSYIEQSKQLDAADAQKDAAAQQDIAESARQAAQARATARVAAGEAGVSGLSVDSLLADYHRNEARYRDAVKHNREGEKAQLKLEKGGLRSQAEARIQSIRPYIASPIQQPDYLGAALRVGSGVLGAGERYDWGRGKDR